MDNTAFTQLANFLKTSSGLVLTPDKAYLITSRLTPVAEQHGFKAVEDLVAAMTLNRNPRIRQDIIEAMTTNETSFFRDVTPFDKFKTVILPDLLVRRKQKKALRILCAAASSGQEPYSLAMILAEMGAQIADWRVEIVGVDIDTKILKRAEEAVYTQFEVQRGLPVQMLMKYFDRMDQSWKLKPIIREKVKFRTCNLLEPFTELGQFDVIFCRNVLIYFDAPTKRNVLDRLANQIASDGYLVLGGAETVLDLTQRFSAAPGSRGLYLPKAAAAPSAARAAI